VFENWALRGIFGPGRNEEKGEERKLHKEELNDVYCLANIVSFTKFIESLYRGE